MSTPVTGEQFLELVVRSGLLPAELLRPYARSAADGQHALAGRLVEDRLLTVFQSRQLLAGRTRGFFLADKYKVLDLIGTGGMGHVFLCEHLLLQRLVAVKLLQRAAADASSGGQAAALERFVREARAVAALDHPNIVRVHDMERASGVPFMVMEYVDGASLHRLVAQSGPLAADRAAHYARQAAAGLQHAHESGLIHRDVKPGNLLLDRAGLVKLLDLGLARFLHDAVRDGNVSARYNDSQSIVGTADYMAPEQTFNATAVDIRSDVYSLGATLYYLLAGRAPFEDEPLAQKLIAHQFREPAAIGSIRKDVPEALSAVLARMTAKDPAKRYQTPAEVVAALSPLARDLIPPPAAAEMPRLPPSAYRLGLSPAAAAPAAWGPHSEPLWEFPLGPDGDELGTETPRMSDDQTAAPPWPAERPEPTAPLPSDLRRAEAAAWPPAGRVTPLRVGVAAALVLLAAAGVWWWQSRENRSDSPTSPPAGPGTSGEPPALAAVMITGSGSTFIRPAMDHWAELYEKQTGVKIVYSGIGSGRGVDNMIDRVSDFGCTDAYLTNDKLAKARGVHGEVVHLPLALGAVVATYNLPGVNTQLRLTGPVLADIYLGKITRWNHEALVASNPGVDLPDREILVIHRSDSSGTTAIWTEYLQEVSGEWADRVKSGSVVTWPAGEGAEYSDGVAKAVSQKVGAIGYVELSFALQRNLRFALVQNRNDRFVEPTLESVTAAANASLRTIPADLRYSLTNAPGEDSYPIVGTTWAVLYVDQTGPRGKELVKFLRWALRDGQAHLKSLRYAPLPPPLVARADAKLATIRTGD
jgi:phosphate ABC transporter phosphate-binding protein